MSTFTIPNPNGQIRQVNQGDIYGELWSTKNIDLTSNPGKIKVSRKLKQVLADGTQIVGKAQALLIYTNLDAAADRKHYYLYTSDRGYRCDIDTDPTNPANWSSVAGTNGAFSASTDAVTFAGEMRISTSTNIARHNGGASFSATWWTADIGGTALTAGKPHTLHVHRGGQETILVTDNNLVHYYNGTAGHTTLTLSDSLVANTLGSGVDTIWVGTYAETSEFAYVYEFAIGDTLPRSAYRIDAQAVLSLDVYNNVPYIVTEKGTIQRFNGAGFETVESFPFAKQGTMLSGIKPGLFDYSSPAIYPKGMRVKDDSFLINISTTSAEAVRPVDERSHSGVWEYNIPTGVLNHRYSLATAATDSGYVRQNEAGPILVVGNDDVSVLVGGGTEFDGLYADTTETPEGYFITPEYYGDSISQAWEKVVPVAYLNGGTIRAKCRTDKRTGFPLYINGVTWLSPTQFTTTSSVTGVLIGDEVEVISIQSAGRLCNITNIEPGTTSIITVDDAIGVADQTSNIRIQNWKRLREDYTTGTFQSIGISPETNPFIQFKVQLIGNVELQKLLIKGNSNNGL